MRSFVQRALVGLGIVAAGVGVGFVGRAWHASMLPGAYNAMDFGRIEFGGGRPVPHGGTLSVARLQGPRGTPDARFRLVARQADVRLASGHVVHALTFDARSP